MEMGMKKKEINYQLLIRRICLIVLDIICIIAASILALLTRFEFDFSQIPKEFLKVIYKYGPFTIVITLIIFSLFRIYSSLWEYAGIEEVFSLIAACLAAAVAKIVIILFTWSVMPRSWYVLDTIYLMILIGATRVSYRLIRLRRQNRTFPWSKRKKVMIIGGGEAGRSLITEIQNSKYLDQKVVCIIDDDPYKIGRYIKGVKVVGNRNSIKKSVKKYNVQQIILTIPSANAAKIRPIVEICQDTNCELMILPGVYQLVNGEVKASKLRPVNIDDLLGRDEVHVNLNEVMDYVSGRVIMVTGGGGSIGSELCRQIAKHSPKQLIIFDIYENNAYDIQQDIFDKIVDADWLEINKYSNGDVLNRFNGDIGTVSSNAISWLPTIVIAIYNFIATFLVILHYNAVMAILALASAPFMLLMSRFMIKKQREYSQKTREMSSKLMTFEVEAFYNFDTIKSFGIAPHYSRLMRWWQGKFKDVSLEYNMFSIKTNILLSVMGTGVEFIAFGYCLFLLWTHTITYGTMTLFLQQRSNLSGAFNNVVSIIPSFLNSSVSAHRIRELVELPKEVHISESEELDPFAEDGFEVLMKDVNFAYVEGTRVITDSYFKACPGEIVALVGPSGEGKTTMIRLILGLIRPQEGEAVIVASNGREIVLNAETRHFFAYVPQGNTILSGTIAENMRMVKEDATDEEIIEALKIACAWEFVEKLPDTINSALGERGRGLSEGQAQRISIARAVLRNAPILLLDEATSALDVTTERKVLRNIIEQKPNKTCIVTTHRPSVLNMCQRVYRVMETKVTELDEEESSRMAMDF